MPLPTLVNRTHHAASVSHSMSKRCYTVVVLLINMQLMQNEPLQVQCSIHTQYYVYIKLQLKSVNEYDKNVERGRYLSSNCVHQQTV